MSCFYFSKNIPDNFHCTPNETMSKRLAKSDNNDVKDFDNTCRKLHVNGWSLEKANKITKRIFGRPKLTDIAVAQTARTVSFDDDVSPTPALAATASAAYAATVATTTEESSKDNDYDSIPSLIVGGECADDTVDPVFLVKLTGIE